MYDITIDLYRNWIDTVKEVFRGSGNPIPGNASDSEVAILYFRQTVQSDEEAAAQQHANEERLQGMQQAIMNNFESVILPDIRKRTRYEGNRFCFQWVYNNGEHIIEEYSSYRIPV
ncbi:hypothetical protein [Paenibacillus sp. JDR-2]|uniref:hypothetical protein n=1 Tax=Paenibacillus sp. (strain JDR-2) TaxID=324057 RepID=UPI0001664075|nr:hypothetical protein [Paenibacillus sp. JDR-2]ACS99949.1 hypothetical protein Pjdr2_1273 [Paenibacillus sp. JDR-2]